MYEWQSGPILLIALFRNVPHLTALKISHFIYVFIVYLRRYAEGVGGNGSVVD
jgi:hypothetical protein